MSGIAMSHNGNGNEQVPMPIQQQVPRPEQQEEPVPQKVTRKRKRITISCTECHRRKQKVHFPFLKSIQARS